MPGAEDGDDIEGKVESSVEEDANIINISGIDEDPAARRPDRQRGGAEPSSSERERVGP